MFNHITRSERLTLPPEGQVLPALFMWITVPLVASFRPSHARTLLSSMCMALGAYACNLINVDIPPWELYTLLAGWAGITLNWLDRVVLANQDKEKWHKLTKEEVLIESKGEKTNLKSEFAIPDTIWGRASWSFAATPVLRGFEWSHQVKNIPKAPPSDTNRWKFVASQIFRALWYTLFCVQVNIFAAHLAAGGGYYNDPLGTTPTPTFFFLSPTQRILACWLFVLICYYQMSIIGSIAYAIGVTLHLWTPSECPPVMGDLTQLYTVRKAWSVVWHQLMRRTATFTGLFAARTMLKLRPSTFASRYVQLFTGFATTGAMHAFGALAVWGHENGEMAFFLGQASAIMVEDHVIELGKALGFKESRFWKVVGFVWVVLWFSVSLQWWVGLSIEKGALVLNRPWDPFGLDAWLRNKP